MMCRYKKAMREELIKDMTSKKDKNCACLNQHCFFFSFFCHANVKTIALDKKLFKMAKTALIFVAKLVNTSNEKHPTFCQLPALQAHPVTCSRSEQLRIVVCFAHFQLGISKHLRCSQFSASQSNSLFASIRTIFSHFSVAPCLMQWSHVATDL